MRKVFLDKLPRWESGKNKGSINWKSAIGQLVRFIYGDIEGEVKIVGYEPKGQLLYIKYQDKEPFKIVTSSFLKCALGKLLDKITDEFKIEIGTHYKDDKRDLVVLNRKHKLENNQNQKYYKYKCNKCGFECGEHYKDGEFKEEHWVIEPSLLNGSGCACCGVNSKIVALGINDIPTTAPWMVKFFQGGYKEAKLYTRSSNNKIKPICPDCGRIKDREMAISNIYRNKSIGCACGDGFSYGHKYMHNLLTQLNAKFIDNHKFDWCKFYNSFKQKEATGEYDFVLKNNKLIIEVDGSFHRNDNHMSGQTKKESKFLDDEKDKVAKKNGYKIIRISDEDSIKDNILKSKLINLFDLSKIDWIQCEEFALSNRTKEVCEFKRDNPNMSANEISNIFNIDRSTIVTYLKNGSKIWDWINYDVKEEKRKGTIKSAKSRVRKVEIFKDEISLGVFESIMELDSQSERLFYVKLRISSISAVCTGRQKSYKGFTFKYVEKSNNNQDITESA